MLQQERKARRREMLASLIHRELSELLLHAVKDPACEGTVIVEVKLNTDLSVATASIRGRHGAEDTTEKALAALNHAAAFMRARLKERLDLKKIPELRFTEDKGIVESVRMSQLLDELMEQIPAQEDEEEGKEAEAK